MLANSAVGTYSYPAPGTPRPHAVTGIAGGPLGTQSFTYDANGSMTVQGPSTRAYDGENRLVSATDGATTTAFVYGPDGARLKKTANGATTLYFGDDIEVIPGASPQYTKYLPGDAKRVGLGGGAVTTWLHRDHLRSVRAITNAAGGIADRANYRPFGEQLGFATADESKGYIGERHDGETGLMYLHARYYDPVLARFIQADPMNPALRGVGVNRYAYAANNPIMFLDPSGLLWGPGPGQGNKETKTPGSGNIGDTKNSGSGSGGYQGGTNSAGDYDPKQTQLANSAVSGPLPPTSLPDPFTPWMPDKVCRACHWGGTPPVPGAPPAADPFPRPPSEDYSSPPAMPPGTTPTKPSETPAPSDETPPEVQADGKVHGVIPDHVPDNWTDDQLNDLKGDLTESIKTREQEQLNLGEDPAHRARIEQERDLLRKVEKVLSGS